MKNRIFLSILLAIPSLFIACTDEGPPGPPGSRGPEGPAGAPGESGYVFEYENINFTAANEYEVFLPFPDPEEFIAYDSDVVLVYFWYGIEEIDGEEVEIWRQLPRIEFVTETGILQYDFDFTKRDVRLFLTADFNLDWLTADYTDEWIARVVIVPAEFWDAGRIDFSDYNSVKEAFGLPELSSDRESNRRP